ncbi:tat (twin-arginine translocation) pathway signal sequence [Paraburkholderia acidisoli]|uniref:Tat (Twin-arginine translocation) pathway signal sequence n=1 Tax=Paraburkholderia acidisoli TaxID=2571748 RepID=A0A7Z2JIY5_9BURK|nr:tat (twin-arginine translocation) pathway signal sequence [Paraburkholderia acidisoli]QGZ64824.1 tat (twin-arginine translocation) pathway signal sequence [Paraburkholderia acidisoli]
MQGKTIAIARVADGPAHEHEHAHQHEHDHDDAPPRITLTRREWLKGSGVLIGTLALSSTLAMFAPSRVWALELKHLDTHQGAVLLAMVKQIYPHKTLDDAVYALAVKDLDAKAQKDAATRKQLAEGVKALDKSAPGGDWTKQSAQAQADNIKAIANTPFFQTVRSTAVVSLYSNTLAYQHFGYGASEGDGGYLFKGFNNLAWLPDPPAQDSGPVPAA